AHLKSWAEALLAGQITALSRVFGGGSRETFFLTIDSCEDQSRSAVLRVETGRGSFSGTAISLLREATAYQALQGSGVPVPAVYGVADDGRALLMERVRGEAVWHRIPNEEQRQVAMDFAR